MSKRKSSNNNSNNKNKNKTKKNPGDDIKYRIPPIEELLLIEDVMVKINDLPVKKLKQKLKEGQWVLKSSKNHLVYERYVVKKNGEVCSQIVCHSCTSGFKADKERCSDLVRPEYTEENNIKFVIKSTYAIENF